MFKTIKTYDKVNEEVHNRDNVRNPITYIGITEDYTMVIENHIYYRRIFIRPWDYVLNLPCGNEMFVEDVCNMTDFDTKLKKVYNNFVSNIKNSDLVHLAYPVCLQRG